jgi:transcriptional regulator with XRE-family HTH domain
MSPVMNSPLPDVIGSALKTAREARKLERLELANLCCLSAKMILELEEGGMTSFYNFPLKINAAKRVGKSLNLSESEYLSYPQPAIESKEGLEEVLLDGVKSEDGLDVTSPEANLSSPQGKPLTSPLDSAITERLEWQELLTEKVGGVVSGPESSYVSKLPPKPVFYLLIGLVIAGTFYGLNEKYELTYQLSSLMDRKLATQENSPAQLTKDGAEGSKIEMPNEPAVSPEVKSAEVPLAPGQCPFKPEGQIFSYQSPSPSKAGDVVNLKTLIKQTICFIDGSGKQLVVGMEPNTAHVFKGVAPFTVLGQDLDNAEMYFQGWKVRLPSAGSKQIKLVEVIL